MLTLYRCSNYTSTSLYILRQKYRGIWCLANIRRQTIAWTNVVPNLCRHMVSLGHNVLKYWTLEMSLAVFSKTHPKYITVSMNMAWISSQVMAIRQNLNEATVSILCSLTNAFLEYRLHYHVSCWVQMLNPDNIILSTFTVCTKLIIAVPPPPPPPPPPPDISKYSKACKSLYIFLSILHAMNNCKWYFKRYGGGIQSRHLHCCCFSLLPQKWRVQWNNKYLKRSWKPQLLNHQ